MNVNFKKHAITTKLVTLYDKNNTPIGITPDQLTAFANLIVLECADIAAGDPFYASFAAKEIRKHFGLE